MKNAKISIAALSVGLTVLAQCSETAMHLEAPPNFPIPVSTNQTVIAYTITAMGMRCS